MRSSCCLYRAMICFAVAVGKAGGVNMFFKSSRELQRSSPPPTRRLTYLQPLPLWQASVHELDAILHLESSVMQPQHVLRKKTEKEKRKLKNHCFVTNSFENVETAYDNVQTMSLCFTTKVLVLVHAHTSTYHSSIRNQKCERGTIICIMIRKGFYPVLYPWVFHTWLLRATWRPT